MVCRARPSRSARVLSVANDYDGLQIGTLTEKRLSPEEARTMLAQTSGKRYDPRYWTPSLR